MTAKSGGSEANTRHVQLPGGNIVSQVVAKIRNEGLLFGLAVIVLLIGLGAQATALGSKDFRFLALMVAVVAFVATIGYYVVQVLQLRTRHFGNQPPGGKTKGELEAQDVTGEAAGVITDDGTADAEGKAKVGDVKKGGIAAGVIVKRRRP